MTTVYFTKEHLEDLRDVSKVTKVPMAELHRQALDLLLYGTKPSFDVVAVVNKAKEAR